LSPVFFCIGINSPHLYEIVNDGCRPDCRIEWLVLGPVCVAKNGDEIVHGLDAVESIPVVGEHLEELFPPLDHSLFGLKTTPLAIDESMVIGHEQREPAQILIVDAIVKPKCDNPWVFCVH